MHPVCTFWLPGAHILKAVHPVCASFSKMLDRLIYNSEEYMNKRPGSPFLGCLIFKY